MFHSKLIAIITNIYFRTTDTQQNKDSTARKALFTEQSPSTQVHFTSALISPPIILQLDPSKHT